MRVTYDEKSFLIDGKRVWLVCGEMHYFRIPRKLWADRMEKAAANGINCISTYMAWNIHEPEQDVYTFDGDADVEEYIRLAESYGLYVILRPGPYICSEWDFGGFPPYLAAQEGIQLRTADPYYMERFEKYFRRILPVLAQHDVEHGGNILLVQNENEHIMPNLPGRASYFDKITELIREAGFLVPIINCNRMWEGTQNGVIECANTWDEPLEDLEKLRTVQPDKPLLITELWCGGCDSWGRSFARIPAEEVYRKVLAILCSGAQYTYYMWHGGTNFGFYGGRLQYGKDYHMITSYDLDGVLPEGGLEGEKYRVSTLVNVLAHTLGPILCDGMKIAWEKKEGTYRIKAEGKETTISVRICAGQEEGTNRFGASMELEGLRLGSHVFSSSGLMPLWLDEREVILYGEEGQTGRILVDGAAYEIQAEKTAQLLGGEAFQITVLSTAEAQTYRLVNGCLQKRTGLDRKPDSTAEAEWRPVACDNPEEYGSRMTGNTAYWQTLPEPVSAEKLGINYGYIWYRLQIESETEGNRRIVLPYSSDRCTIYHDGIRVGTCGTGAGANPDGVELPFKKGTNLFYVLLDNLGRMNHSYKMGEPKGIYGPVYEGRQAELIRLAEGREVPHASRLVPVDWLPGFEERDREWLSYTFYGNGEVDMYLRAELNGCVQLWVNGKHLAEFQNPGRGFGECSIPAEWLNKGENQIDIAAYPEKGVPIFRELTLTELLPLDCTMEYVPWRPYPEKGEQGQRKEYPVWFEARIKGLSCDKPSFLHLPTGSKGQLYMNGHNLGRVWSGVPQDTYYLPECWIKEENELLFYCENSSMRKAFVTEITGTRTFIEVADGSANQFDVC